MHSDTPLPLAGIQVLEIGGGAAAAYCGRLLADAGATVRSTAPDEARRLAGIVRADTPAEQAYAAWLAAGKQVLPTASGEALAALGRTADLVLVGEASGADADATQPRIAFTLFTGKTGGGKTIRRPASAAQSCMLFLE